jgi:predicted nucleotidyltransferase
MRSPTKPDVALASDEHILSIVEQVIARFRPKKVILYGSYAYGHPTPESDIDILVVVDNPPDWREAWLRLRDIRQRSAVYPQIVFISTQEFEESKDVVGGIAYPAHHWGKVLYESET